MSVLRIAVVMAAWIVPATEAASVPQQQPFPPFEVDQVKVDQAIESGVAWLKKRSVAHLRRFKKIERDMQNCELVLYTYVHAGVPETDPAFKELWDDMFKRNLEATYCVSLQAMILEEVDRVKWQKRIQACAQFLVDNQCESGQWTYGSPTIFAELDDTPSISRKAVVSGRKRKPLRKFGQLPPPGVKVKPPVVRKLTVRQQRKGPKWGDNSNTQYAALGLRACHDAGIILPKDIIRKAESWWRGSQYDDRKLPEEPLIEGGVGGAFKPGQKIPFGSRGGRATYTTYAMKRARPAGWCYRPPHDDHEAYGSMTAGAVGSLAIYNYIKDNDGGRRQSWKNDKDLHEGLQWLAKNFTVTYNPGPYEHADQPRDSQAQYYYYLYALERAGMLYGTEVIGNHKWYPEGVKALLERQKADGGWGNDVKTCFAILFLKRATAPLSVVTHSAGSK